jgi:signal transduction histidine kinase
MRNPLSAVIQSADSTIESLKTVSAVLAHDRSVHETLRKRLDSELRMSTDSLNTIISCSLHQKRVVDDILTLSKMDSNLMTISPVRTEPAAIVSDAVHMFELESRKDGIDIKFFEDSSLRILGAQYVMMDPSRTLQILINLITNAIKFTRDRLRREIEVSVGATLDRPGETWDGVKFAPITTSAGSLLEKDDWGHGTMVHVWIKCRDTGCGLSKEEQGNLFTRFSQATPKTHIKYGGSGLGLFISKRLTELQGGAIGVSSAPNIGSTFAFFVATRLARPPTPLRSQGDKELTLEGRNSRTLAVTATNTFAYSVLIVEDNLVVSKCG